MEFGTISQILSLSILSAAGAALLLDFVNARRELTKAMVEWQVGREETPR
jgi:hypothetical protein